MLQWEDVDKYICAEEWQRLQSAFRNAERCVFLSWLISMGLKLTAVFNWQGNVPFTHPLRCQENYFFQKARLLTHSSLSALIFSIEAFPCALRFSLWRRSWKQIMLICKRLFLPCLLGCMACVLCQGPCSHVSSWGKDSTKCYDWCNPEKMLLEKLNCCRCLCPPPV